MRSNQIRIIVLLISLNITTFSYASSHNCGDRTLSTPQDIALRTEQAKVLRQLLDNSGDRVIALFRQGQSLSDYGLIFSHGAYAVKTLTGHWRVYHNLNECGTDRSNLYIQGLYQFLDDDLSENTVATLHFSFDLQERLLTTLTNRQKRQDLHQAHYNMIAYPFSIEMQNSNGWILIVLGAAVSSQVTSLSTGIDWLTSQSYVSSSLSVSFVKRTMADMFIPHISISDQPNTNIIYFNSGDSLLNFMNNYGKKQINCEHGNWGSSVCLFALPN